MAILTMELARNIFQPCYIFPSDIDIRDLLLEHAIQDPEKESFCRAVLLAISPEEQNAILEQRKETFLQSVGSYWFATQDVEFQQRLKLVVDRACETWRFFQYNKNRYETDHEWLEWGDGEWEHFPFEDQSDTSQDKVVDRDSDQPFLTIFPRLCRVDSKGLNPINDGVVLTKSQCIDAERELKKKDPSSPRMMRTNSDRPRVRNMSISVGHSTDQNGSFLGGGQANS